MASYDRILIITFTIFLPIYSWSQVFDSWPMVVGNTWIFEHTFSKEVLELGNGIKTYSDPQNDMIKNAETHAVIDQNDFIDMIDEFGIADVSSIILKSQIELKIIKKEEIDGKEYFQFNNGQLMRKDEIGSVWEYSNRFEDNEQRELLVFDFTGIAQNNYKYQMKYKPIPPTLGISEYPIGETTRNHADVDLSIGKYEAYQFTYRAFFNTERYNGYISIFFVNRIGPVLTEVGGSKYELISFILRDQKPSNTGISSQNWSAVKETYVRQRY